MFLDLDKIQTQQKIVKRQAVMPKKNNIVFTLCVLSLEANYYFILYKLYKLECLH